jgi:hypothetical protein
MPDDMHPPRPSGGRGRGSKLDAYASLLPTLSDIEAGKLAGVHPETVRIYRIRHGIGKPSGEAAPVSEPPPAKNNRRSTLDAFASLIGQVPDSEVAKRAGVSRTAVYQYRRTRGIALSAPPEPAPEPPPVALPAAPYAFDVTIEAGRSRRQATLVAASFLDAVTLAVAALKSGERLVGVSEHLPVLG